MISGGATIVEGGDFGPSETTMFSIPIAATKPNLQTQPDLLLVDNDMDVGVNVDVDNTATQEVEVEDKDGDATTQEELLATFNDITNQTTVESDDIIVEGIEDVLLGFRLRLRLYLRRMILMSNLSIEIDTYWAVCLSNQAGIV